MDNKFYVYVWYNPKDNIPFYVGKGTGNRAYQVCDKSRNKYFLRKYNKLVKENYNPYVEILKDNLLETDALNLELKLIKKYKPTFEGGILTNLSYSSGGKSVISDSTKEKLSNASSGSKNGCSKFTEEIIRECFVLLCKNLSNTEIEKVTGVPSYIISDLKLGKKWKHIYNEFSDKLSNIKISGLNKNNWSFEQKLEIINDIVSYKENGLYLKDLAPKYGVTKEYIISINLKRQWKSIWDYYDKNRKS